MKDSNGKHWDRNKARLASMQQLPTSDKKQTAQNFGLPASIADLSSAGQEIPKMECTTTTQSDYCKPSLDRYMNVANVSPEKDYPASVGLEYCEGRPVPHKQKSAEDGLPDMPITPYTCVLPKETDYRGLKYQKIPQNQSKSFYTSSYKSSFLPPKICTQSPGAAEQRPDYIANVDYSSPQPNFKWPAPATQLASIDRDKTPGAEPAPAKEKRKRVEFDEKQETQHSESLTNTPTLAGNHVLNYQVESEEHIKQREIYDANMDLARKEYFQNLGVPGSTIPLVRASVNPPNPEAHYNVPNYTQEASAGGMVRPRYGIPSRSLNLPSIDPSYPNAEYRIPSPEAGLTKTQYATNPILNDCSPGAPGVKWMPPVRYPDKIYRTPGTGSPNAMPHKFPTDSSPPPPSEVDEAKNERIESPLAHDHGPQPGEQNQPAESDTKPQTYDQTSLQGLRRIRTTNQMYGSWFDDPYLKGNDWWFRAKPVLPPQKTFF
ncbi:Hypothetical protein NTJ_05148 [Nesidiocoris tenuis]|uniref:SoHo domain-containing protein n=1 Tax=Nesidiocoris tenuis TaxID=355587 RepID=A0ABN7AN58_9HEMI|nr:Hypothetical protein NTJ_05148 [Nesidiocoris tenuis]